MLVRDIYVVCKYLWWIYIIDFLIKIVIYFRLWVLYIFLVNCRLFWIKIVIFFLFVLVSEVYKMFWEWEEFDFNLYIGLKLGSKNVGK